MMTNRINRIQARADRRSLCPPVKSAFSNFHGEVTTTFKTVHEKRTTARNARQAFMVQNSRDSKSITVSGCRSRELSAQRVIQANQRSQIGIGGREKTLLRPGHGGLAVHDVGRGCVA